MSSGSACSDAVVNPTRSANSTETILRCSSDGCDGTTGAPQAGQKRTGPGRTPPHREQVGFRDAPQLAQKPASPGLETPQASQTFTVGQSSPVPWRL